MTIISPYNSHKIGVLYVVLIYFVLIIHSALVDLEGMPISRALVDFWGNFGLSVASVPLFYAISGLLFFKGGLTVASDCYPKIAKRMRTLLVPYVLWNLIYASFFIALSMIPHVSCFVSSDVSSTISNNGLLCNLYYLFIQPIGFHLWFLRDLMIYVLVSPLIFLCIKKHPWQTLLFVYLFFGWFNNIGITYFVLGAIIALHFELDDVNRFHSGKILWICAMIYILNAVMCCFHITYVVSIVNIEYVRQLISLSGIIAFWGGYDLLYKRLSCPTVGKLLSAITPFTFFIYLFHEPSLNIVKKIGILMLGKSDIGLSSVYLFTPIVMVVLSFMMGKCLKAITPRVYSILVGGR